MKTDRKHRKPVLQRPEQRQAVRKSIYCGVRYTYEGQRLTYSADGFTDDLSKNKGGTHASMIPPIKTRVTLDLLDQQPLLSLDATITWVAGDSFGAHFPAVTAKDYTRIRRYLRSLPNR